MTRSPLTKYSSNFPQSNINSQRDNLPSNRLTRSPIPERMGDRVLKEQRQNIVSKTQGVTASQDKTLYEMMISKQKENAKNKIERLNLEGRTNRKQRE